MPETLTLAVDAAAIGQRLDRWLALRLPDRSRSEIQRWIQAGLVVIDARPARAGQKLQAGQIVAAAVPDVVESTGPAAEPIPLPIVYEDGDLLVVDKPAGMVVHPAPGHSGGTLVNAVLHHCPKLEGVGGERRPGIVHRLDRDTSGLIVVAKNDRAHRNLQTQFARRRVYKEYLALLEGHLEPRQGRIAVPVGRHPVDRKRQAVLPPDPVTGQSTGRKAITEYNIAGYYSTRLWGGQMANFTLVRAVLHTGRTHQIRVHFAWLKRPLVGDTVYGYRNQRLSLGRQFLHAHRLRFQLPATGEETEFTSPLPEDLASLLRELEEENG